MGDFRVYEMKREGGFVLITTNIDKSEFTQDYKIKLKMQYYNTELSCPRLIDSNLSLPYDHNGKVAVLVFNETDWATPRRLLPVGAKVLGILNDVNEMSEKYGDNWAEKYSLRVGFHLI